MSRGPRPPRRASGQKPAAEQPAPLHRVVIVAMDDIVGFDLAIPSDTFACVRLADGQPGYRVRVCGAKKEVDAGRYSVRVWYGLRELQHADTIVLPGIRDIDAEVPPALIAALRRAAARGVRIASICSGAFVLAATGLLDGRRATTHWRITSELARRYPRIRVDPDVLYVDEGQFLTSAGVAAGVDLCLHIVRNDHGSAVAAETARMTVMPLHRDGSQAQVIDHAAPAPDTTSIATLLDWLERNLDAELTLPQIANRAAMSVRSLNRRFREQTGTTPLQWLIRSRVRRAQQLLETTSHSVEHIASHVGFGSATALRDHFRRIIDTSPAAYRLAFKPARARASAQARRA